MCNVKMLKESAKMVWILNWLNNYDKYYLNPNILLT